MSTQTTQRTITLTGRAPVRITDAAWPVIASARADSYQSPDYSRHQQALAGGELDRYPLRVRRPADGWTLVYGILSGARAWTGTEDRRGGVLLEDGDDVAAACARVGRDVGLPDSVIRECVADLPVEDIG